MIHSRGALSTSRLVSRRTFFASSTDFTRLLQDSEVHCMPQDDGVKQYVLAASGMEEAMVRKVPQLHLARLYLKNDIMYGAKVVNRTLGDIPNVCARLVDAARKDGGKEARSNLHGLAEWVISEKLEGLEDAEIKIVARIADGNIDTYDKKIWEKLALEYVNEAKGDEANLYLEKGASLIRIEHHIDTSEFSDTSGGAMAIFEFKN
jgi:hypothetical protein